MYQFIYCNNRERRDTRFLSVKIFDNYLVFIQGDKESDLGYPIWIGCIFPNTVYDKFQK